MVESRSITTGSAPGPAPSAQARRIVSAITLSSWRMCPKVKARKKVPSVEGAITRNGRTLCVAPARRRSTWSMWVAPVEDRRHQGEHLSPRTCPADPTTEAHHLVHQRLEPQADHEGGRHEEPGVSDERRIVEGHRNAFDRCAMMSSQEVPLWIGIMWRREPPFSQAGRHFPRIRGPQLTRSIGGSRLSHEEMHTFDRAGLIGHWQSSRRSGHGSGGSVTSVRPLRQRRRASRVGGRWRARCRSSCAGRRGTLRPTGHNGGPS